MRKGKRPPAGQCVYCLGEFDSLTEDHVFPDSYYPDSTPLSLAKPKVPACLKCNNYFSRIEKEILIPIGFCLDRDDPACSGIPQKALRTLDPRQAKSPRDRAHRIAKYEQIGRRMIKAAQTPLPADGSGVVPGFGPWPTGSEEDRINVDGKLLETLTGKLVRGFTFLETGRFITTEYLIEFGLMHEKGGRGFVERLTGAVPRHLGPGLIITSLRYRPDPVMHAVEYRIWTKLRLYACVNRAEDVGPVRDPWDLVYGPKA